VAHPNQAGWDSTGRRLPTFRVRPVDQAHVALCAGYHPADTRGPARLIPEHSVYALVLVSLPDNDTSPAISSPTLRTVFLIPT